MTDKKTVDSRQFLLIQAASLNQNILVQSRTIEPAKGGHYNYNDNHHGGTNYNRHGCNYDYNRSGETVRLKKIGTRGASSTITDDNDCYNFADLRDGAYNIKGEVR